MIIKDIFEKSIERDIKGVIKVGQHDDENIKQELEEYVVTRELKKHFSGFFESYKKGIVDRTDKTGVWISGFFGSGKSHFLKILSYLLQNKEVDGKTAISYFEDDKKISDNALLEDMKLAAKTPTDVVLFNVDSKSEAAGKKSKMAIVTVFMKVFNEMQGFCSSNGFIADLERKLTEENKYEEFKNLYFKTYDEPWVEARNDFDFIQDNVIDVLSTMGFMSEESARGWCDKALGTYAIDPTTFAKMVKEYLDKKGSNHHIVFLVDEIGQYIGDDRDLMLNLQTIVEDLGSSCTGRAWVVVTSQQDIDSINKSIFKDFSKIQGRFDTRLSLSSANVDEVIKKRILRKNESADKTLELLYEQKSTIVKNLIIFNDDAEKKLYENADSFAKVYPFVPYQFNLLGNVLTSIRTHGASGKHLAEGERSMLALFKESAVAIKDEEIGKLIPFNLFYDALEQFLDHSHKGVISKAWDNDIINPEKNEDCFIVNVLKTLFMVKYVKEIRSNLENIASLMVDSIGNDRIELKKRVEDALDILVRQTLVQKNGDIYVFLTNEEQEIRREIDKENVEVAEITNKISSQIFEEIYGEDRYKYPAFGSRYAFRFNQVVDDRPYRANQNYDITLKFVTANSDMNMDEAFLRMASAQDASVLVMLSQERAYITELKAAIQIEKYLSRNSSSGLPNIVQLKASLNEEHTKHTGDAKLFLEEALKNADIYVNGDKCNISTRDVKSRINEALDKLINTIFHKLSYIDTPTDESDIRMLFSKERQIGLEDESKSVNEPALKDMYDYISLNSARHIKTSMKTLLDRFLKAPYGFIEADVWWLVAKLFKDGKIILNVNNEQISFINKSNDEIIKYITRREFNNKLLMEQKEATPENQKKAVREVMKELFGRPSVSEDEDSVMKSFIGYSVNLKNELEKLEIRVTGNTAYPGAGVIKLGKRLFGNVISMKYTNEFYKYILSEKDSFLDFAEDLEPVKSFYEGDQITIFTKAQKLMKIYDDSKTFIVNREIEKTVAEIKGIMRKNSPYGEIYKLPELSDKFLSLYSAVLESMAEPVLNAVDTAEKRVFDELRGKQCCDMLSQGVKERFGELRKKGETCNNVATLQNIKAEADALKIRLLDEIATKEAQLAADNIPENTKDPDCSTAAPRQKIKKQKTISIKTVNAENSWQIETKEDVDKYINSLRQKLVNSLEEDTVIHIEF